MSLTARIVAVLVLALALVAGSWKLYLVIDRGGYDRAKAEDASAMQAQATRNRELQRQAELRYTVAAQTRDRFFVTTVREIRDAAAPLAACPVPEPVVRLLNDAARCARSDSPAACGAPVQVPGS